ncbi:hypothetical protein LP109_14565 (plasmid) [Moraxella bovis]|uniref:Uncharacterized protein n=1 Tax=Moraxella bovis TaxID=476 RepID=A0ABY6MDE7_MORBO|nr:hypothetical protein [Moraxella bovis]UYZ79774.1 hypothetical protein LP115_14190 [Moraxella bovis]UYZ88264.1 hypothetical protein LP094_14080 [Moraxella bovis]UYZ90990.1 hypothetical protein LP114_14455 [Moraxella bovis]UYZ99206.1 hypothetical protein LP107_14125 [Moraxella bovis]UZA01897.1 hypothetical protein LP086_13995 [Moraxella bovis]
MNIIEIIESFDKDTAENQVKELADLLYTNKKISNNKCKSLFVKLVLRELQDRGNTNMWCIYELLVNPAYRKTLDEFIEEVSGKVKETSKRKIISDTQNPIFDLLWGNRPISEEVIKANRKLKRDIFYLEMQYWFLRVLLFVIEFMTAVLIAYIIYYAWIK